MEEFANWHILAYKRAKVKENANISKSNPTHSNSFSFNRLEFTLQTSPTLLISPHSSKPPHLSSLF